VKGGVGSMQYANIRGLNISKFTLGTVQLGMEYGIANKNGKPDTDKSFSILKMAIDGGANSFDTSLHYGDSEVVIGDFFSAGQSGLEYPILTTKFKVSPGDHLTDKDVEKQIYEFVENSLQRLKIKKIPIYMLHNPQDMTLYGNILPNTMKKLKDEGLIGMAAVSVYTNEEVDEMLKNDIYEAIQIPMNIIDNRLIKGGSLKRLHDANKIVFVRSVFLQGLFFTNPSELTGNLKDAEGILRKLATLADREGMSIAQLALSYIRDMKEVTSLVIGAEAPEQVKENIKLMEGPAISEKTENEIKNIFDNISVHILNPGLWKR